nr:hypothetical protein [Tanacetum cinerariifolium]
MLWQIVLERFASSEPKNFSDDFLMNTLKTMFEKPNVEAHIWKSQRGSYGLAKVMSWRLLESCKVHIITFTTTQMILLVERRYPLTRFTLDQMLNNVRLEVEEDSEVSLELLRFISFRCYIVKMRVLHQSFMRSVVVDHKVLTSFWISVNAFTIDHVTEKFHCRQPEFTLGKLSEQFLLLNQSQYQLKVSFMLLLILEVDQYVIDENDHEVIQVWFAHPIHQIHEYSWCIGQSKWHYLELIVTIGNPQHALKEKGVIDSGCSRHMTGNISYLSDFEEINRGYVAFGGNTKGGKITGIKREFSVARTPQRNGIAERKNMTLIKDARTMLVGKFDGKADEGFLVGYSVSSKAFRVFNSRTRIVQETLHINFLENQPNITGNGPTWLFDIDTLTKSMNYQPVIAGNQPNLSAGIQEHFDAGKAREGNVQQYVLFPLWSTGSKDPHNTDATFEVKDPESEVHVSPSTSAKTKKHDDKTKREAKRKSHVKFSTGVRNLSEEFEDFADNNINEVNAASSPVPAVRQILTNSTNTFSAVGPSNTAVSPTHGKSSYVDPSQYLDDPFMPASKDITYYDDEEDVAPQTRSMTKMVKEQGGLTQINNDFFHTCMFACFLSQEEPKRDEGMDYEEVFAPVAKIESIRLFLAYASFMGFMVYQMDVKSAFLYGNIKEEVFADDIIFGSTNKDLCKAFEKLMKDQFKMSSMDGKSASTPIDTEKPVLKDPDSEDVDVHTYRSMIGSLMYLTLSRPDIMFAVCACAHFQVTPKASHFLAVKRIFRYLKGKPHLDLWYPKDSPFNLVAYSDSDYAGASLDRKSTTGGCQFLGYRLISWQCKKQTVVATSSTKAEYVAAASCCAQALWIQNQLLDYGYNFIHTIIYIDNSSTIFAKIESIRLFLAYASFMGFMIYQMDVKSAFLYGNIKEEVYVCQPPGFEDPNYPNKVCKVVKALYVLHQAPRDGKSASTPIDTEKPVLKDLDSEDVDVHTYRSMIGSLMYLTSSRPDIMFAVCACAHFQVTPKASHFLAVKRIFRYLKGKPHLDLWYPKDSPFNLVAYSDSDYAGASLDRKSITGDDAKSIDCLPNEEIFAQLPRMGYEKPSTKLTFYKTFFLAQWKFLIHTILQCMSAKRIAWNEFSSSMALAVICLETEDEDVVEPTPPTPATTSPPQQELIPSKSQVTPTPPPSLHQSPIAQPSSPPQQQQPLQSS